MDKTEMKKPTEVMPLPRDGDVAVQEELAAARCKNTVEAYYPFIARHPAHPLAVAAEGELRRLRQF